MPKQTFLNLPESKREHILECAVDEFAEHGYNNASINRVVASAGIAKGSFYQYFEDKEDLYGCVIELMIVERKQSLSLRELAKLDELNFTQFIRELFFAMIREFIDKPKLMKISDDYIKHRYEPVQNRIFKKYQNLQDNYFQQFIDYEKNRGEIDQNADSDVLAYMVTGVAQQINNDIQARGVSALTEEYIGGMLDKMEYILTNGIYNTR